MAFGGGRSPKLTLEQQAELRELRAGGMKLRELCTRYDVAMSTVCRYLNPEPVPVASSPRLPVLGPLLSPDD